MAKVGDDRFLKTENGDLLTEDGHQPWVIDGRTGRAVVRGELVARLNQRPATIRRLCQPTSTADGLMEVAAAIVCGAELILFDMDFSPQEITALGYSPTQLNQTVPVGAGAEITSALLAQLAAGASRARLGLFSSGSTGLPKLVWQSVANLARAVKVSPARAEAVWALAFNPTHVAAIQVYLQALANGCTIVDIHGLDRAATLEALKRYGVTHLSATPSFYRLLLPMDRPLLGLKSVALGGETAEPRLLAKLAEIFPEARIRNVYASTEAGTLLVAEGEVFAIAPELMGRVVVREGKIHVHRSLLGEFVSEGQKADIGGRTADEEWYDTGDVVEVVSREPLRFRIVARERDWVNVGGSKVNPQEVESVLGGHSGVAQVRVFGRKNSVMGHILCAEVVLAEADSGLQTAEGGRVTEPALRDYAATRLQAFKVPRVIRFVDSLATTRTGKLRRIEEMR